MSEEFKVIETQEQLNEVIGARIKRAEEKASAKYEGWTSPEELEKLKETYNAEIKKLTDAAAGVQTALEEKDAKIAEGEKYRTVLEKTRIAIEAGLKVEYAERLRGDTEEEWRADAEALAKDFAASHVVAPLGTGEPQITKEASTREKFAEWMSENIGGN